MPERTRPSTEPKTAELNYLDALFSKGLFAELEASARSLVSQYPDSGFVWKLLSISLQMQGKDALLAFAEAARFLPDDAEAQVNYAAALRAAGQSQAAVESNRRALAIRPDFAQAHNNLGVALQDLSQMDEAIASYYRAIELKPDFIEAFNNLGSALKDIEQFDAAITAYQHALKIKPSYAKIHSNLGIAQQNIGQLKEAENSYNNALKIDPSCVEAATGIIQINIARGEMVVAEQSLNAIIATHPDNLDARLLLTRLKKVTPEDQNMTALIAVEAEQLNRPTLPLRKTILLQFALGKSFDDCADYTQAMQHYLQGCRLKRGTFEYDSKRISEHVEDIIRIFDKETVSRLRKSHHSSPLPIFILGMPRSGTTLIEQIIANHPEVHGAGELPDLLNIIHAHTPEKSPTYPLNIPHTNPEMFAAWAQTYLAQLQKHAPDARHITDKMPDNFWAIGLIHALLPNAKIIHVNRNPVDTCLSNFTQLFTTGQHYSYNLTELGLYYADYFRLMAHWRNTLPATAFLDVHYENIVSNPDEQARRLIEFCDLPWNDACLNPHDNDRPILTASRVQARQPIYRTSVARWRRYESVLAPLLNALGELAPK